MASDRITSADEPRSFLATPSYLRLWFAGGIGNAMRWLELLVAGIFTWEVTQSTVLVALGTVSRSLPMLFIGTIAGVVGEVLNRKRLLVIQLLVMAATSSRTPDGDPDHGWPGALWIEPGLEETDQDVTCKPQLRDG
jgi:hypothetical protein